MNVSLHGPSLKQYETKGTMNFWLNYDAKNEPDYTKSNWELTLLILAHRWHWIDYWELYVSKLVFPRKAKEPSVVSTGSLRRELPLSSEQVCVCQSLWPCFPQQVGAWLEPVVDRLMILRRRHNLRLTLFEEKLIDAELKPFHRARLMSLFFSSPVVLSTYVVRMELLFAL